MSVTLTLGSETIESTSHPDEYRDGNFEESHEMQRELQMIVFDNCSDGIGLKFTGGCSLDGEVNHGIFVCRILPGKAADACGDVRVGDQVVEVNGESLDGVSYKRAISIIRQAAATNQIRMLICRDQYSRAEFKDILVEQGDQKFAVVNEFSQQQQINGERGSGSSAEKMVSSGSYSSHQTLSPPPAAASTCPGLPQEAFHRPDSLMSLSELPPRPRSAAPASASHMTNRQPSPKLSRNPQERLHVEKLEEGLRCLGLDPTPEQQLQLRQHLSISMDGKVPFGEFVRATREVFRGQLKGLLSPSGGYPVDTPFLQHWAGSEDGAMAARTILETNQEELHLEIQRLQHFLFDKERAHKRAEEEIRRLRQEAQAAIQECRSLHSQLNTANKALQSARNLEQDYDDVIELLENEIVQLRNTHTKSEMLSNPDQRRMAVLACQLKKTESARRRGDVAVEKLFDYVEHVQEVLAEVTGATAATAKDAGKKGEGQSSQQPKPNKKHMLQALADTGQAVIKTVKSILETVPLPYGWEEAYTDDGIKYYINHLNQTTSWTHPVSGVQHGTEGQEPQARPPPPPQNPQQ